MNELCIRCKEKPIFIKKRKLCQKCYSEFMQEKYKKQPKKVRAKENIIIRYGREMYFVKNFFTHTNWFYQPATFHLLTGNYTPDFYDGERNVFVEVAGTRQAFHSNKEKYKEFIKTFPEINFEIRLVSGEIIDINAEKQHINNNQGRKSLT